MFSDLKNNNLKGLYAYPDTVNEIIDIINNYGAAPTSGPPGRHNTRTSSGVQFEQVQVPSAAEICAMPPVSVSNGQTI